MLLSLPVGTHGLQQESIERGTSLRVKCGHNSASAEADDLANMPISTANKWKRNSKSQASAAAGSGRRRAEDPG
jgi:hypothetical protein